MSVPFRRLRMTVLLTALGSSTFLGGCAWLTALQETDSEPDFPKWTKAMSGNVRPAEEKKTAAAPKSKSLFFNERSREVEKSIGYEE